MQVFNRFSIRAKLGILVSIAVIATASVAWFGRKSVSELDRVSQQLVFNGDRIATHMTADMMHDALRGDVMAAILAEDDASRKAASDDVIEHATLLRSSIDKNKRGNTAAESSRLMEAAIPSLERYITEATQMVEVGIKNPAAARERMQSFMAAFSDLETALGTITEKLDAEARRVQSAGVTAATRLLILASAIAAIVLVLISVLIGRSITSRLTGIVDVLHAVARRDFTQRMTVTANDEIGAMSSSLNTALEAVDRAFCEVRDVANQITQASATLAASSEHISSGAQQQAASLEETAASLEEITATVKQSASNAQHASQLAVTSRETAESGGQVMQNAMTAMEQVSQASRKIGEIIGTIDEIALQTNLLALNAAVEAARAGEQGRGFAVVAAGVGDLAQRSAGAAKEVKSLIQDALKRVEASSGLVDRSGRALGEIITSVKQVTDIFGEIAAAAREQSAGVDQVNEAVSQMDRVTQSNSAQTSQLSSMAEQLARHAHQLDSLLDQFKLSGAGTVVTPPAPRVVLPQAPMAPTSPMMRRSGAARPEVGVEVV